MEIDEYDDFLLVLNFEREFFSNLQLNTMNNLRFLFLDIQLPN